MALTDTKIKQAKPREKAYPLADEKSMHLFVRPNGSKTFRLRYRQLDGKENTFTIGTYPEITLKEARELRDAARAQLAKGIDPNQAKKAAKAIHGEINSFAALAHEWYAKQLPSWKESTAKKRLSLLKNDLLPWLGSRQVDGITSRDLLSTLQRIESRGANDTAHNARQVLEQVFRFARVTQRTSNDPVKDLKGALAPVVVKHRAAITEPKELGRLLVDIDHYRARHYPVRILLALFPLLFQRTGDMIAMRWQDIDFEAREWRFIPQKSIKKAICPEGIPHIVPLCTQAIALLMDLHPLTGDKVYVFHSQMRQGKHVSEGTAMKALRQMGYDTSETQSGHGFRATARTILDEVLGFRVELIEHQQARAVRDVMGRAYNRTTHLPQRKEMMQKWADYLDALKLQASTPNVITGSFGRAS
jgi:integrase